MHMAGAAGEPSQPVDETRFEHAIDAIERDERAIARRGQRDRYGAALGRPPQVGERDPFALAAGPRSPGSRH